MSAALDAFASRIAANTLTTADQNALLEALDGISPTFPTPDQTSNGIPQSEEGLARLWMAVLYAINAEGVPVPPVGAPITAFALSAETHFVNGPVIAAHKTVTPMASGKFRLLLTGGVQNESDTGPVRVRVGFGHGATAVFDFEGGEGEASNNSGEGATNVSCAVDLDQLSPPIVFDVGTPVQLNALCGVDETATPGQAIQWLDGGLQFTITEKPA